MPQLDRIIVFSQIFWLFIIFTFTYAIILHFFLPIFLKVLKTRKKIVEFNNSETMRIVDNFNKRQILLNHILLKNLNAVKKLLLSNLILKSLNSSYSTDVIDKKSSIVIRDIVLYCDSNLLRSILLIPKPLLLKVFN